MKAWLTIALLGCASSAFAQANCWQDARTQLESTAPVNALPKSDKPNDDECLAEVLRDPETLNRILKLLTESENGSLLKNLHLEFKAIEAPDPSGVSDATRAHLGVAFRYDKSVLTSPVGSVCGEACMQALNLRFAAQGTIAFESDVNPRDFIEAHVTAGWFRSSGGAKRLSPEAQDQYNDLVIKAAQIPQGREAELVAIDKQISRLLAGHLTDQLAFEFDADVALESNQAFTQKHWVYAARAAADFRGWSSLNAASWRDASTAAKLNVFDYPFALLRRLSGYSECDATDHGVGSCFVPMGTSWPTVSVALGQVQPSANEPRSRLVGTETYSRLAIEVSFKTPVAKWQDKPVYVSANWRRFDELSAPDLVRAADLAHYSYFVATLGPQRGLFASYSTGRLPFDRRDDQVYELGFRTVLD